ncbi:hypothetical protein SDRG_16585 [Saprolegnia diclina VS20]|uniref:PX domain-containing protein n=1 Tax=Saprolegnia diclina (strain VS20) TaxID=1156394 RepID=T0R7U9_SAPDV|nr:hypothetical protein SDRG_16585 [Saprolegnia diclina VS20]EQC25567.1 hypothetical protein SDRG_16585 [Saprolegnia diclina VS20]|eukprot:XP_008621023.1 hypothetical protein SDRG_16585 [Saprolegnia diclina VS20]
MGNVASWCTGAPDPTSVIKHVTHAGLSTTMSLEDVLAMDEPSPTSNMPTTGPSTTLPDATPVPSIDPTPTTHHVFVRQRSQSLGHLVELAAESDHNSECMTRKRATSMDVPPTSVDGFLSPASFAVRTVSFTLHFGKGSVYVFHVQVGSDPVLVVTKTRRECKKLYASLKHFVRCPLPPFPPKTGLLRSKEVSNAESTSFMQDFLEHFLAISAVRTAKVTQEFFLLHAPLICH